MWVKLLDKRMPNGVDITFEFNPESPKKWLKAIYRKDGLLLDTAFYKDIQRTNHQRAKVRTLHSIPTLKKLISEMKKYTNSSHLS